jgi:hypothetical protein
MASLIRWQRWKRVASLDLNGTLRYIFPDNGGLNADSMQSEAIRGNQRQSEAIRGNGGLNADDVMKAKALGIDAQIAAEIHVGSGGGLDEAAHLFARHPDFHQTAVNRRRGCLVHVQALSEGG